MGHRGIKLNVGSQGGEEKFKDSGAKRPQRWASEKERATRKPGEARGFIGKSAG